MPTYSHSRLNCFEQCPRKFKFNYIDHIETEVEQTVEAFLGSLVHTSLQKLYKDMKFEKLMSSEELVAFYNDEWQRNWNDDILVVREDYTADNYRKMGERFLSDYHKRYAPFNQSRTIGLETEEFLDIKDYKLHIRIDRLADAGNGNYEIHDYKTSNSLPTQQELDEDRQLALYSMWVMRSYPDAMSVKLVWHYLAFDKEMSSERRPEQLDDLKKEILLLIKCIEAEKEFKARPSALCDWCEFQELCPAWKHQFQTDQLKPEEFLQEDGVKLVNEYAKAKEELDRMQEKLDMLRDALARYADEKEVTSIFGSGVQASVNSYDRMSFPKRDEPEYGRFMEVIKKIGLWDRVAAVDVYQLARMINSNEVHPELKALLDVFITKGKNVVVRIRKRWD